MEMEHSKKSHHQAPGNNHYKKLLLMTVLSFIAMYLLMYSMVDIFSNVIPNVNQFYMAGLMTMPMVIIELAIMGGMYKKKKLNLAIFVASSILLVCFFFGIRQQAAIGDKQFLKSMIPHHAAAILMAGKANIKDPEIKKITEQNITNQKAEIKKIKAKLKEMK